MMQTSAKLAAGSRPPQREASTWGRQGEEPSSPLHQLKGWGLALLCQKNHSIPPPTNSAACFAFCSGSLAVKVTQARVKTWPFSEQLLAVVLQPWAWCSVGLSLPALTIHSAPSRQLTEQTALWTLGQTKKTQTTNKTKKAKLLSRKWFKTALFVSASFSWMIFRRHSSTPPWIILAKNVCDILIIKYKCYCK